MEFEQRYRVDVAKVTSHVDGLLGVEDRLVVVDGSGDLHREATRWLGYLRDIGRSPNTIKAYGERLAWYLSWTELTADWRDVDLQHLAMWKRTLSATPFRTAHGVDSFRTDATVGLWLTPLRSFYLWCGAHRLLRSDLTSRLTQVKYFPPGSPGGGEYGATRQVLADELRPSTRTRPDASPKWVDDPEARERLEVLHLNERDRFLIDLLYFTGLRAGEALALFTRDLQFGGGACSHANCDLVDPHLHVVLYNPVENGARAKGAARAVFVGPLLVERYIDYALTRRALLGDRDESPHVFVNLYSRGEPQGRAMSYAGVRRVVARVSDKIEFDLSGPHVLRHTFATRLLRGIDCDQQPRHVISALMGHRSTASTDVYTHDLERAKKAALASMRPRSIVLGDA